MSNDMLKQCDCVACKIEREEKARQEPSGTLTDLRRALMSVPGVRKVQIAGDVPHIRRPAGIAVIVEHDRGSSLEIYKEVEAAVESVRPAGVVVTVAYKPAAEGWQSLPALVFRGPTQFESAMKTGRVKASDDGRNWACGKCGRENVCKLAHPELPANHQKNRWLLCSTCRGENRQLESTRDGLAPMRIGLGKTLVPLLAQAAVGMTDEPGPCSECRGKGYVELFLGPSPCRTCKGGAS